MMRKVVRLSGSFTLIVACPSAPVTTEPAQKAVEAKSVRAVIVGASLPSDLSSAP